MSLAHIFTLTGDGRLRQLLYKKVTGHCVQALGSGKPHKTTLELNQTR